MSTTPNTTHDLMEDGCSRADWELCCEHLAPSKAGQSPLPQATLEKAFCSADGFGDVGRKVLTFNNGWDWSHVRDASPEGLRRAANVLRRALGLEEREA